MHKNILTVLILIISILFLRCSNRHTDVTGTVTEVGNPSAFNGVVLNTSGKPVSNAEIVLYSRKPIQNYNPYYFQEKWMLREITHTNSDGKFTFNCKESGTYLFEGMQKASGLFFSIVKTKEEATVFYPDTLVLKKAGSIAGTIYALGMGLDGHTNEVILVNVENSNRITFSDSAGHYLIPDLAEGIYRIGFYPFNNYLPKFMDSIRVFSDSTVTLDTIILQPDQSYIPPPPINVTGEYNSTSMVVNVHWNKVQVEDLLGYKVERRNTFGDIEKVTPIITDTSWTDTIPNLPENTRIFYVVRSVDKSFNESLNAEPLTIIIK